MPTHTATGEDLFPLAALDAETMHRITSAAVGHPVAIQAVTHQAFPYQWGSIPTAGLWRVDVDYANCLGAGRYSYFVKLLRNPRLWPQLPMLPEAIRESILEHMPWKFEHEMYQCGIGEVLPEGMRMPLLHHGEVIGDDYIALWWEFVDVDPHPWSHDDFARTAELLGRLAARRREGAVVNELLPERCHLGGDLRALRYFVANRVMSIDLGLLREDSVWKAPLIAEALIAVGDPDLPGDMLALADRIPAILDRLDELPQTYSHGDASPQNLLIPTADRSERIVIDWGFGSLMSIGFDLGQLLIGLAHAGEIDPEELPGIQSVIEPAFVDGLTAEGYECPPAVVHEGFIGALVARSALSAIPFEVLDRPESEDSAALIRNRLRLTRVLVDLSKELG